MEVKQSDTPAEVQKKVEIHNSAELKLGWSKIHRARKGWWLDSSTFEIVASRDRLDGIKAPCSWNYYDKVREEQEADSDARPRKYLLRDVYILVLTCSNKKYAILFEEDNEHVYVVSDRDLDTIQWEGYEQNGLRAVVNFFSGDVELQCLLRNPTTKILHDVGVLDMFVKQFVDRQAIDL
jgi:hypothetical protein